MLWVASGRPEPQNFHWDSYSAVVVQEYSYPLKEEVSNYSAMAAAAESKAPALAPKDQKVDPDTAAANAAAPLYNAAAAPVRDAHTHTAGTAGAAAAGASAASEVVEEDQHTLRLQDRH